MALHLFPLPGLKSPATSLRASGPETRTTATAEGAGEVARATMVSPSPVEGPGGKNEVGEGGEEVADGFDAAAGASGERTEARPRRWGGVGGCEEEGA